MIKKVIFKYPLPDSQVFSMDLPLGAKIIALKVQGDRPVLWAMVHPEEEKETRGFLIVGTGEIFDSTMKKYIGTWIDHPFVWHLFEVKS